MERSEAIREFNDCKFYVIKALELIKDDSLKFAFMGRYNVKLFNAAEKIGKVHDYILDAKYGSMQIFKELLNLRTTTRELRNEAILKGYDPFAVTCDIIIDIIDDVEKWESDNGNQGEVQNSEIGDKGIMENVLTRDEIIKGVEGINPFKPLNSDEPINYEEYYKRLCNGGVIDSRYGLDLFTYCVDRADISKIIARPKKRKDSKKSFARLFMNDVSHVFSDDDNYRKAAAKAFNLGENTHIGSVGGIVKAEYQELMKGLFKTNWQKKK